MRQRIIFRYSEGFKRQVVEDLERGRFDTIDAAQRHYDITGHGTVTQWLSRYGKNDLRAKVVRVAKPDEADRIRELKRQVSDLQRALGQTQAEKVLNEEYLKLACERLGQDVETFKKKSAGRPSMPPRHNGRDV
jgi:transposase-like protein